MALIEWRDEFSVGVPAVDFEHREMIALINSLYASLSDAEAPISVAEFLGEIHAKIAAHFALEEKMMRAQGYDQYRDHKADHERLLDEIRDIMDDHETRSAFDPTLLSRRLEAWFVNHFKTRDARLHKHLR